MNVLFHNVIIQKEFSLNFEFKLHGLVLLMSLPKHCSMNPLIGIPEWVAVADDESISFYMLVTLFLLVPSIMIDESKTFNLTYSFNWYFCLSPILQKEKLR